LRVVVLGGGSTGEHFVGALRRLDGDAELTLVERRLVGGECSYWACMPTKTMLRGPEIVAESRRAPGVDPAGLDTPGIFQWRELVVSGRDDASQVEWLEAQRCELVRGDASVLRPGVVQVGDRELAYDRLVIATGSAPAVPPIPGLDELDFWTNVEATETAEVPSSLVVLGGGPVGCELAQFFARMGSQVTLVEGEERILGRIDAEATALVAEALREDGVDVHVRSKVVEVDGKAVVLESGDRLPFERLLLATGRRPNTDGLDALGLTIGRTGIQVDERLRAAEDVWAIGDVTGIALFTHVGKYQARVAAHDMTGRPARADYRAVPATVFTDPQVATVGKLEGTVAKWPLTKTPRLSTYERPKRDGFVKIAADPERRVLNGAVAVGPDAGEWLQQLTLAIRAETPIEVLLDVIQPYPTFSEAVFLALRELGLDLEP
jgi:pyruvate/2-oxoglutarate dehydrogenase complex dihydrolipoamide dehydrogenase (E3) component